jgi:hypothetical protein
MFFTPISTDRMRSDFEPTRQQTVSRHIPPEPPVEIEPTTFLINSPDYRDYCPSRRPLYFRTASRR